MLSLLNFTPIAPNLHHRLPCSLAHDSTRRLSKDDLPDAIARLPELPDVIPCVGFEQTHTPVVAARDKETGVELERRDGRVVRRDAVQRFECG
jgi:hypothetical protein